MPNHRSDSASADRPLTHEERRRRYFRKYYLANKEIFLARVKGRRERAKELISELKKGPCADCGNTYPAVCMDFHHVRGDKLESIAKMLGWAEHQIIGEIAKCELICANCHRIRHAR